MFECRFYSFDQQSPPWVHWTAFVTSLALHSCLLFVRPGSFQTNTQAPVEIDITNVGNAGMGLGTGALPAPPKPYIGRKTTPAAESPLPVPGTPASTPAPEPQAAAPPGPSNGEYGIGNGGSASPLSALPQLLNLSDLAAILQKFYPEQARAAGRESTVVLDIHIDTSGRVLSADVVHSGGTDFDVAAVRAAKLLRFTPAYLGNQAVPVKMRQAIRFKLE